MKETNDPQIPKARLVVKGSGELRKDEILKDSPTCSKENLRVVFSGIAALNIKAAFLQGENIDRELYVLPPKEANKDKIWLLKKCTYGLLDVSRQWCNTFKHVLLSIGFKMSKADQSLFSCQNNNKLEDIITIHVDDFLSARNEQFFKDTISKIREKFTEGKECNTAFHYLGLDLKEHRNYISLD